VETYAGRISLDLIKLWVYLCIPNLILHSVGVKGVSGQVDLN